MSRRIRVLFWLFVVGAFVGVGSMDYSDAKQFEAEYCANVYNTVWPDYMKLYKENCKDGEVIEK